MRQRLSLTKLEASEEKNKLRQRVPHPIPAHSFVIGPIVINIHSTSHKVGSQLNVAQIAADDDVAKSTRS